MSDNKYTLEEMIAVIKKALDERKRGDYPHSVVELINERDMLARELREANARADRERSNYLHKFGEWEKLKKENDKLKAENNKMALDLADIRKVLDGA